MKSKISSLVVFSSLLFGADDYSLNVGLLYSPITLDGHQKLGDGVVKTTFDDLGISGSQTAITPIVELVYLKNHKIYFSYLSNNYSGNKVLNQDITKNNYTFITGETINSNMDTTWLYSGYRYDFGDTFFGFDIHNYKYSVAISDNLNSTSIENSFTFPTLAFDMVSKIDKYSLNYGASVGEGSDVSYFNFYLSGGFDFEYIKQSNISFGYKQSEFYINDGIYETFHRYKGPFVNLIVKF